MINISIISNNTLLGKILRLPLKLIPGDCKVFILQGKLIGKKWIKGSGVNGYWLGTYELDKQTLFGKYVKAGDVVFDIGAHVGFYSLLSAQLAGKDGKVFAFEPSPGNFEYLKTHSLINDFSNIEPINAAVSFKDGYSFFSRDKNSSQGHLSGEGDLKVKTVSLDSWVIKERIPLPDVMKIDVEGAEADVLRGAHEILKSRHPVIFLSIHNREAHDSCIRLLNSLKYNFKYLKEGDETEIIVYYKAL